MGLMPFEIHKVVLEEDSGPEAKAGSNMVLAMWGAAVGQKHPIAAPSQPTEVAETTSGTIGIVKIGNFISNASKCMASGT